MASSGSAAPHASGRQAQPRRIPLCDPVLFGVIAVACGVCFALGIGLAALMGGQAGGFETAVAQTEGGDGDNWIKILVWLAVAPFAVFCFYLPKAIHSVVVDHEGIALERRGRRLWSLPWSQYAGWRWAVDGEGRKGALTLVATEGPPRPLVMTAAAQDDLLAALRAWAPNQPELPAIPPPIPKRNYGWFAVSLGVLGLLVAGLYQWRGLSPFPPAFIGALFLAGGIWLLKRSP